ncbi:uncharacterized protein LOC110107266 [Dendrobium catenatum]|uniref:uncharacterized protein LOC110107266 n=1 Tax=Dendrobium catenatum TaxID=906689 RepID=UPI0010A0AF0C|nr:uncharacterized protein LOC110107266 [Dendrobium catenatum]
MHDDTFSSRDILDSPRNTARLSSEIPSKCNRSPAVWPVCFIRCFAPLVCFIRLARRRLKSKIDCSKERKVLAASSFLYSLSSPKFQWLPFQAPCSRKDSSKFVERSQISCGLILPTVLEYMAVATSNLSNVSIVGDECIFIGSLSQ